MLLYISIGVGILIFVLRSLYVAFLSSLRDIPGPWLAKFTDTWRAYHAWRGNLPQVLKKAQAQYGDVIRIGPNCVSVSEKGQFETILGTKQDYVKSDSLKVWRPLNKGKPVEGIANTQSKKVHNELKKPIASIYSLTNVMQYECRVDETITLFLRRLDEEFMSGDKSGKPCDIDNWLQYFAFDFIGNITISRPLGFLEEGKDIDSMLRLLHEEFQYRGWIQNIPWMDRLLRKNPLYLWYKTPTNKMLVRALKPMNERKRDVEKASHGDVFDRFIEAQKAHPEIVTEQVLAGYTAINYFAGSDTTAIVMRTILYYVLKTPGVLQKLRDELAAANVSFPVPYEVASRLPYLTAIVREAMRIHPVPSILLERVVPAGEGHKLNSGKVLPPGTTIALTAWTLHFDETLFGAEPEEFRPDRWLKKDGETPDQFEKRHAMMKHNEISFSYGPRVCLGRHIAILEMYKAMAVFLGVLDFQFVHPERPWRVNGASLARQYDMDVYVKWRPGVDKEKYVKV